MQLTKVDSILLQFKPQSFGDTDLDCVQKYFLSDAIAQLSLLA